MAKEKEKEMENTVVQDHKCLVYWRKEGICTIPVKQGDGGVARTSLYPGYNTVNFSDMPFIAKQCKDVIDQEYLRPIHMNITYIENGDPIVKETALLRNMSATELKKICSETTNPHTLEDLNNPDVVGPKNEDIAEKRIEELKKATGTEPENIDIKKN